MHSKSPCRADPVYPYHRWLSFCIRCAQALPDKPLMYTVSSLRFHFLLILFQFDFLHLSQNRVFHTIPQIGLIQRFLSIIQICPSRFLYQKCRKVALPAKIFLTIDVARRCLQNLCGLCIFLVCTNYNTLSISGPKAAPSAITKIFSFL